MVIQEQEFLHHLLVVETDLSCHQVTNPPLECLNDELFPCKIASGLFLCTLTNEQEFHLEDVQFAGQDKILSYQDFSSQIHSLNDLLFLLTLLEPLQDLNHQHILQQ